MNIIEFIKENKITVTLTPDMDLALIGDAIDHDMPLYHHNKKGETVRMNIDEITTELNRIIKEKYNLENQVQSYTNQYTNAKGLLIKREIVRKTLGTNVLTSIIEKEDWIQYANRRINRTIK